MVSHIDVPKNEYCFLIFSKKMFSKKILINKANLVVFLSNYKFGMVLVPNSNIRNKLHVSYSS